jgi:protein Mpv17
MLSFLCRGTRSAPGEIRQKLWPTMLRNWQLWPFAGLINFKFVPGQFRILFVCSVSVVWNTYLSTVGNAH